MFTIFQFYRMIALLFHWKILKTEIFWTFIWQHDAKAKTFIQINLNGFSWVHTSTAEVFLLLQKNISFALFRKQYFISKMYEITQSTSQNSINWMQLKIKRKHFMVTHRDDYTHHILLVSNSFRLLRFIFMFSVSKLLFQLQLIAL